MIWPLSGRPSMGQQPDRREGDRRRMTTMDRDLPTTINEEMMANDE
jgi:hypothetical protein